MRRLAETRTRIAHQNHMSLLGRGIHGAGLLALAAGMMYAGSAPATETPRFLKNFQEVNDSLYRGAQPSKEGFRELAKMGVHTVIDLRGPGPRSSKEAEFVRSLGMQYVNVPLDGFKAPRPGEISKLLGMLENKSGGPVFVHCRRGADRTGTLVALYRIEHDHWSNRQALGEAKSMKMASTEILMRKLILQYKPSSAEARLKQ
jgi:protein tyrosine/serine phosphatase